MRFVERNKSVAVASEPCELKWYAAYTSANHERSVASQLEARGVEHFLPTYSSVRQWKDRRVTLELPLFPGYVFVRMALGARPLIVQTPGVARIVGFGGLPAALPEEEIEGLQKGLVSGVRAEPHAFLSVGRRVRVRNGPLSGMEGIVVRRKNLNRFVISLELIQRSVAVDIEVADLEAISQTTPVATKQFISGTRAPFRIESNGKR